MTVALLNANTMAVTAVSPVSAAMSVTASGANRCAFAVIAYDNNAAMSVTAVSYGGQTMTSAGAAAHNATGQTYAEVWYLVNPPTGSNTLSITVTGTIGDIYYNLVSFTGVNQTTPVRAGTYTTGTGLSLTISSNTNDLTMSLINGGTGTVNAGNQTEDSFNTGGNDNAAHDHCTTAAASVTHTWTGGVNPAIVGLSINGDPNNAGGGWVGSGSRRAPAKAGPFDRRGMLLSPYQQYSYAPSFTLNAYSFSADPGTYAVTGQTASLLRAAALPTLAGSYTLTGAAAKLLVGHAVNAGTATYAINGVASTELRTLLLNAGTGAYSLSGFAATLQAPSPDHPLVVNPATYALTGASAAALRGLTTTVTGAYAISGAPALFRIQRGVPDAPTAYAMNGAAATLIYSGSGPAARVPWQRMGMRIGL